jgi:hypothetical protein
MPLHYVAAVLQSCDYERYAPRARSMGAYQWPSLRRAAPPRAPSRADADAPSPALVLRARQMLTSANRHGILKPVHNGVGTCNNSHSEQRSYSPLSPHPPVHVLGSGSGDDLTAGGRGCTSMRDRQLERARMQRCGTGQIRPPATTTATLVMYAVSASPPLAVENRSTTRANEALATCLCGDAAGARRGSVVPKRTRCCEGARNCPLSTDADGGADELLRSHA